MYYELARGSEGGIVGGSMSGKFLHTADWHMGRLPSQALGDADVVDQRYKEHRQTQAYILDMVERESIDWLLLAGDIIEHGCLPARDLHWLVDRLGSLSAQVLISPGNHDPLLPDSPYRQVVWPANVHIFGSDWDYRYFASHDLIIYGRGFSDIHEPIASLPPRIGDGEAGGAKWRFLLVHADITSSNAGSVYFPLSLGELATSSFHYVALGHVHRPWQRELTNPAGTILRYPGSPEGHTYSETGQRTVTLGHLSPLGLRLTYPVVSRCSHHQHTIDWTGPVTHGELEQKMIEVLECMDPMDYHLLRLVGPIQIPLDIEGGLNTLRARGWARVRIEDGTQPVIDPQTVVGRGGPAAQFVIEIQRKLQMASNEEEKNCLEQALQVGLRAFFPPT